MTGNQDKKHFEIKEKIANFFFLVTRKRRKSDDLENQPYKVYSNLQ